MISRLRSLQSLLILLYAAALPVTLTGSWIVLIAGLVVAALIGIARTTGGEPPAALLRQALLKPPLSPQVLVLAATFAFSGLVNGGVGEAAACLVTLRALLVYYWACNTLEPELIKKAVSVLLVLGSIAGIWGAVQQLTGFHPFSYQYLQGTGFFGGPMAFAGQMQIFSLLALGLYLRKGYVDMWGLVARTPVFLAVVACNVLGVLFASERSAWLGFIAGVIAVCAICSWRTIAAGMAALSLIGLAGWQFVPVVKQRLLPLLDWHHDVSVRVRLFLWQQSLTLFKQSPFFGVGVRRFPHFDIKEAIVPGHSVDINHAHSNYIQIATTTGIIGLTAYLWLWLSALGKAFETCRRSSLPAFQQALSLGILGGIVALMVSGLFEYNFGTAQVRLAHWFVLAMLTVGSPVAAESAVADSAVSFCGSK